MILAIDVGTTTARAAAFDLGGARLSLARRPLTTFSPAPGRAEQDAAAVWAATQAVIAEAVAGAGRQGADIAALGIATQRASLVVWDRRTGEPLAPMVLWSDARGAGRADTLRAAGFFVSVQQAACKAEALLANLDEADPARVAIGGLDAFLVHRLTGESLTDRSQAWPLGWLDLASLDWNAALLAHQGLSPALLPRLVDTHGALAETDRRLLAARIPLAAIIADQQAALFVHGAAPGTAKLTLGTAAALDVDTGGEIAFKGEGLPPLIVAHAAGRTRWCAEAMIADASRADLPARLAEVAGALVPPGVELKVDGGRTADETLMQACAEALQRPLRRFSGGDATLAGAALAAALGAGLIAPGEAAAFACYDRLFAP